MYFHKMKTLNILLKQRDKRNGWIVFNI
jgi:hypothetical protein